MPRPDDGAGLPDAAPLFAALGDPVRLAMVARLCRDGPLPTVALQRCAGALSRQGVTKHLQVLQDAGVVASDRIGRDRRWRLQPQPLQTLRDQLDRIAQEWDRRLERLRAFVEDDAG